MSKLNTTVIATVNQQNSSVLQAIDMLPQVIRTILEAKFGQIPSLVITNMQQLKSSSNVPHTVRVKVRNTGNYSDAYEALLEQVLTSKSFKILVINEYNKIFGLSPILDVSSSFDSEEEEHKHEFHDKSKVDNDDFDIVITPKIDQNGKLIYQLSLAQNLPQNRVASMQSSGGLITSLLTPEFGTNSAHQNLFRLNNKITGLRSIPLATQSPLNVNDIPLIGLDRWANEIDIVMDGNMQPNLRDQSISNIVRNTANPGSPYYSIAKSPFNSSFLYPMTDTNAVNAYGWHEFYENCILGTKSNGINGINTVVSKSGRGIIAVMTTMYGENGNIYSESSSSDLVEISLPELATLSHKLWYKNLQVNDVAAGTIIGSIEIQNSLV